MRVLWISIIAVLVDQATKVLVVRNMYQHQSISVIGDWLKLTYLENPGMAFGISFGPPSMISIFSIIATFLIVVYLFKVRTGFLPYRSSIGLVLGGAFGNIIDRTFYGAIYYDNPLFQGRVVDFIHIDFWRGALPEWIPLMGGNHIALFPIWNVADMAIVIGVVGILIFQKKFHALIIDEEIIDGSDISSSDALSTTAEDVTHSNIPATDTSEDSSVPLEASSNSSDGVSELPKNSTSADSATSEGNDR